METLITGCLLTSSTVSLEPDEVYGIEMVPTKTKEWFPAETNSFGEVVRGKFRDFDMFDVAEVVIFDL